MTLEQQLHEMGVNARKASRALARFSTKQKNSFLLGMADGLEKAIPVVLEANAKDMDGGKNTGLSNALLDRLMLDTKRLTGVVKAIRTVAAFRDPVGRILTTTVRPNGLTIEKIAVPIGVVAIIYESRPNVTADAASLCLKAGNASILRGGKEAIHSNLAIAQALMEGGKAAGLPDSAIQVIPMIDREAIRILTRMDKYIDMIVPRGGHNLIEAVLEGARVPIIKHAAGICHVYVDKKADLGVAEKIAINSKCQRPGVCNAMETLLVHKDVAESFLPKLGEALVQRKVEMRGDAETCRLISSAKEVTEQDWRTEYLDFILSIRVVESLDEAIQHIEEYGSHHSDCIVTKDKIASDRFLREVDSAVVYVNASTRFTDGGEFGMGAEIGISTDKLHARGPMGLDELTTFKYVVHGDGQIRE
ncbi:MAG: glutamate-5-semialdehyde dehydrogenase [Verrucomicrobiota bacterium]|nr:glutamate-5-semialdehyde dehydrogenase [Verrucomicrobiota bacterium]